MSCNNHLKSPKNYLRKLSDRATLLLSLSLVSITTLSATILSSIIPSAHAEDSFIDKVNITVPVSCTLGSSGTTSHTGTVNNGSTVNDIGTTNLKITCNDGTGYALYAIGYTNNEYGNTNLEDASLGSSHSINTSTTISSDTSSWAMKLGRTGSTYLPIIAGSSFDTNKQSGDPDFSNYTAVPSTYQKVAYFPSSTDVGTSANGSNLTTTYRAHISQSQPMGTYKGKVKYALVHPSTAGAPVYPLAPSDCPAGYVCYAPNASDIEGSMSSLGSITSSPIAGKISVGTSATEINLIAPNYKREGYGFAGWSTDFEATNSSTIYGPNETLTVPSNTLVTNGMILYPVWIASTGTLQGDNNQGWTGCSSLTTAPNDGTRATLASMTALTDTRDNNVYTVARLADGKCWMVENLRLADTHNDNDNIVTTTITTSNTNNPLNTNGTVSLKIDYANNTTANHLASTSDSWCTQYSQASCVDQTMLNTNNTNYGGKNASNTDLTSSYNGYGTTSQWYGYGNYYNWYSATAGNGTFGKSSGNVTGDLCPTGWHLPYGNTGTSGTNIGGTSGGFSYLDTKLTSPDGSHGNGQYQDTSIASQRWRVFPNNFIYSGYWNGSLANLRGNFGYYWSSSAYDYYGAYYLYLNSSSVGPGTGGNYKYYGFSVRCVAGS